MDNDGSIIDLFEISLINRLIFSNNAFRIDFLLKSGKSFEIYFQLSYYELNNQELKDEIEKSYDLLIDRWKNPILCDDVFKPFENVMQYYRYRKK